VALVILLIVVILIVVGVHSCQVSARNSSLRDYNNNVSTIITESNQTGQEVFDALSNTSGSGGAVGVQSKIAAAANRATNELNQAKKLSFPDEVKKAQQYFDTQLTATEKHPWYSKLPHSLAPDGRGGVCSTFVDLTYGEHFQYASHLPTTPFTFATSPELKQVADRSITQIEALKK